MVKLEVTIDDRLWPKLSMVAKRVNLDGSPVVLTQSILYDQAYNKFEGDLHNMLRPMVEQLIKRRLGGR